MNITSNLSRRLFLRNTAVAGAVLTTAVAPAVAAPVSLSPRERLLAALEEVKAAAQELWPDIEGWTEPAVPTDAEGPYVAIPVMLIAHKPALPVHLEWSGPAIYEIQDGKYRPVYFIDRVYAEMDKCYMYRACHWWKGRSDGPNVYFSDRTLKIIRKVREV
ncbi:hypothetical protein [Mesorhizobium sp. DCY119]|uniref:hypothetical protein n=1 Tax=Mesorhizobium sp. DCY119 TaxID=2108445 RepID=UPI000E6D1071|nr:hypothetical protein [Mesorhizobium sp. DCY119]RJG46646.1 hypothetical protein D3Y55_21915 [Mesorhizobium sp. DCY119]